MFLVPIIFILMRNIGYCTSICKLPFYPTLSSINTSRLYTSHIPLIIGHENTNDQLHTFIKRSSSVEWQPFAHLFVLGILIHHRVLCSHSFLVLSFPNHQRLSWLTSLTLGNHLCLAQVKVLVSRCLSRVTLQHQHD